MPRWEKGLAGKPLKQMLALSLKALARSLCHWNMPLPVRLARPFLLWDRSPRHRGLSYPGTDVWGPPPFHTPRQSERGTPLLWDLWGVRALGDQLQWRRDFLMKPHIRNWAFSDALAFRQLTTSIVCADFRRTRVIFDPPSTNLRKDFDRSDLQGTEVPLDLKYLSLLLVMLLT